MASHNFERNMALAAVSLPLILGSVACSSEAPPVDAPIIATNPHFIPAEPLTAVRESAPPMADTDEKEGYTNLSEQLNGLVAPAVADLLPRPGVFEEGPGDSPSYNGFAKNIRVGNTKLRVSGSIEPGTYTYTYGISTPPNSEGKVQTLVQVVEQGDAGDPSFKDGNAELDPQQFVADINQPKNTGSVVSVLVRSPTVNLEMQRDDTSSATQWNLVDPRTGEPPVGLQEDGVAAASRIYEKVHTIIVEQVDNAAAAIN